MSGNGSSWSWQGSSKDIQGRMKRCNLYWKKLESADKEKDIIYRLEQMWLEQDVIFEPCSLWVFSEVRCSICCGTSGLDKHFSFFLLFFLI